MVKFERSWFVFATLAVAASLFLRGESNLAFAQSTTDSTFSPSSVSSPTPTYTPPPPPVTGADSSAGSITDVAKARFNQMITNRVLGTVLLGVNEQVNCSDCVSAFGSAGSFSAGLHGRKEITSNLVAAGGYRLHPIQRRRLQRHQRADRSVRAALRFRRLGLVTAVLRYRHHPDAVREGALQPQLRDQPRPGFAGEPDRRRELRRLWPGGLDQPAVAARRGRRLRRGLAVMATGQRLYRSGRGAQSVQRRDRRPAPIGPTSSRSADSGRICSAAASRAISTAASCSRLAIIPASSPP